MTEKPKLLDLFCGVGGAAMGYYRAGFEVVGVDIKPQPHYPFEFHQGDALAIMDLLLAGGHFRVSCESDNILTRSYTIGLGLESFAALHGGLACKADNQAVFCRPDSEKLRASYPRLIVPTRERLLAIGKPFVIENVPLARRQLRNPIMLCGTMFGLKVRRHRYFELQGFEILFMPSGCGCKGKAGFTNASSGFSAFKNGAKLISVAGHNFAVEDARQAMLIDWTGQEGLSQAIPPTYTEYIGKYLMQAVMRQRG